MSEEEDKTDYFDTDQAVKRMGTMWKELGEMLAAAIPDIVTGDDPVKAIHWATCAEACFWKATGEGSSHDVKDVLPPLIPAE